MRANARAAPVLGVERSGQQRDDQRAHPGCAVVEAHHGGEDHRGVRGSGLVGERDEAVRTQRQRDGQQEDRAGCRPPAIEHHRRTHHEQGGDEQRAREPRGASGGPWESDLVELARRGLERERQAHDARTRSWCRATARARVTIRDAAPTAGCSATSTGRPRSPAERAGDAVGPRRGSTSPSRWKGRPDGLAVTPERTPALASPR